MPANQSKHQSNQSIKPDRSRVFVRLRNGTSHKCTGWRFCTRSTAIATDSHPRDTRAPKIRCAGVPLPPLSVSLSPPLSSFSSRRGGRARVAADTDVTRLLDIARATYFYLIYAEARARARYDLFIRIWNINPSAASTAANIISADIRC